MSQWRAGEQEQQHRVRTSPALGGPRTGAERRAEGNAQQGAHGRAEERHLSSVPVHVGRKLPVLVQRVCNPSI